MFKTCPHCLTLNNIANEQLVDGMVMCAHCHTRFDVNPSPSKTSAAAPALVIADDDRINRIEASLTSTSISKHSGLFRWFMINLLLVMLLAGQYAYFKRDQLTEYPGLRPWLITFCDYLQCELKLIRDIQQIRIVSREVESHPTLKNTLKIDLVFINDAPYRQPWPTISLSFSDLSGKKIAQRSFDPTDYLPSDSEIDQGMPSQEPIETDLLLIDPGRNAVNFVFNFL